MSEAKVRRFIVEIPSFSRSERRISWAYSIGVVCDAYDFGVFGLSFSGSGVPDSMSRRLVFAVAPEQWLTCYELSDHEDWPDDIVAIHGEGVRERWEYKCNPTP